MGDVEPPLNGTFAARIEWLLWAARHVKPGNSVRQGQISRALDITLRQLAAKPKSKGRQEQMSSQRIERLRAEGRARNRQAQERINRGQAKVPTNDEALRATAEGMRASGQDAEVAAQQGAQRVRDGVTRREMVEAHAAGGDDLHAPETSDELYARAEKDPNLMETLSPIQRIAYGRWLQQRDFDADVAERDRATAAEEEADFNAGR